MRKGMTEFSIRQPWIVLGILIAITIFFAFQFPKIKIDTDPQNMLEADEPVRLFHAFTQDEFNLSDFLAVGVVAEPSAFTPDLLNRIYRITAEIEEIDGVIADDIMAPSAVDDIKQGAGGVLLIGPLMEDEIETQEEADYILSRIVGNPILRGKLASDDGKAIALFIPIESKDVSSRVAAEIRAITDSLGGGATYHIAGLPLAENAFGDEMFKQMAISAPAAMLIIAILLFVFFKQLKIVIGPMVVAMMSVIWSMGLLILTGNTVHIMSSMIPIFLIPIAVLNSIHLLSEFTESYKISGDKRETMRNSVKELFLPMLFTSLTTVAGFISLALTPIPPVRVFGAFVAFGIATAWFLSLVVNPAITTLISDKTLQRFSVQDNSTGALARVCHKKRSLVSKRSRTIVVVAVIMMIVSGYGLTLIKVNDNPVKWFKESHPIRIADKVMNEHLAGTYMNYLVFNSEEPDRMKAPEVQKYIESVQQELLSNQVVGSTTGLPDIIKKIRYELMEADSSKLVIPESQDEIAQLLFMFEMSGGSPDDLFKFVTSDYTRANLWVQLRKGDNIAVSSVVDQVDQYLIEHPAPEGIEVKWAGLPYINIEWQHQMVSGMGKSLISSYIVVFLMMIFLFRSFSWGLISMLPLTITIMAIYGFIGYIGKPYDMPVAVLSSLTLGLSIDFAIHFIQRKRTLFKRLQKFELSFHQIFEGTGRAITRNVLVIAIGFIPMLFSTLVPYITVGAFFLAIMILSGLVTMLLLPAISRMFHKSLFKATAGQVSIDPSTCEPMATENQ